MCPHSSLGSFDEPTRATGPLTGTPVVDIGRRDLVDGRVDGFAKLAGDADHAVGALGRSADPETPVAAREDLLRDRVEEAVIGIGLAVRLGRLDERQREPLPEHREVAPRVQVERGSGHRADVGLDQRRIATRS